MTSPSPFFKSLSARFAAALLVACGGVVAGQDSLDFQELQNNLRTAYAKIQALEKAASAGGAPSAALVESTAAANAEAAEWKDRYAQLRGLLDALGIAALENAGDEKSDRLIAALNDLRLMKEENQRLAASLNELLTASDSFSQVATPGNPDSVRELSAAMESAQTALATSQASLGEGARKELSAARVLSVKTDLGVIVLDVGSRDGAKPGMPFNIFREDKPVARVLITDVRSAVSGAVVRELFSPSDKPMVGDLGRAEASQSL